MSPCLDYTSSYFENVRLCMLTFRTLSFSENSCAPIDRKWLIFVIGTVTWVHEISKMCIRYNIVCQTLPC